MDLISEGLRLRALEPKDADVLYTLMADPEVEAQVLGWSGPVSLASQDAWVRGIKPSDFRYGIEVEGALVGVVHAHPLDFKNRVANVNVKILPRHQGRGYASRAIRLLLQFLFLELDMHIVTAGVLESNEGSQRLFRRLGFTADGRLRDRVYKNGRRLAVLQFSLMRSEFDSW